MHCQNLKQYMLSRQNHRLRSLIAVSLLLPATLAADPGVARLEVVVSGISEIQGSMAIAIFGSEAAFDARSDPVEAVRLPIATDSVAWSVELAASATYAVIVYQDLNDNGEIDMGRFGRPQEPYGFSNDARGRFGPPPFEEARIDLGPEGLVVQIEID